jgi:5'(3')-deoxyribonucleotidase
MSKDMNKCLVVDVDNVLVDSITPVLEIINKRYKRNYSKEDIRNPKLVGSVNILPQQIFSIQRESWGNWSLIKPLEEDIRDRLNELEEIGLEIIISTSSPQPIPGNMKQWLHSHGIGAFDFKPLKRGTSKCIISCEYLVDDTVQEARKFALSGRIAFLYKQPWNISAALPRNTFRIDAMKQVIDYFLESSS